MIVVREIDLNGSGVADKAGIHEHVHAVNGETQRGLKDVVRRPKT